MRLADRDRKRQRKASGKGKYQFVCQGCGIAYRTDYKDRNKYHSRECAFKHKATGPRPKPKECAECGSEYQRQNGYDNNYCSLACHDKAFSSVCKVCGREFVGARREQKQCGDDECRKAFERNRYYENFVSVAETNPEVTKKCARCGKKFTANYYATRRIYCSKRCMTRATKRANNYQRAKLFGVKRKKFSELRILKRDGWKCYICGVHTPQELRGTFEDNAPEIDHVIPMSKGGPHTPDNVRCCCRKCNIAKSDRTLKEMRRAAAVPLFAEAGS